MKCKDLRIRSKKYEKYYYCSHEKKKINFEDCRTCQYKEYKQYKKMKTKTSKLRKLEANRESILTDDFTHCFLCKKFLDKSKCEINRHEVFYGTGNRIMSIKYKLVVPLCDNCHTIDNLAIHNNYFTDLKLKQLAQKAFEELYSHEKFIEIFKNSYL